MIHRHTVFIPRTDAGNSFVKSITPTRKVVKTTNNQYLGLFKRNILMNIKCDSFPSSY